MVSKIIFEYLFPHFLTSLKSHMHDSLHKMSLNLHTIRVGSLGCHPWPVGSLNVGSMPWVGPAMGVAPGQVTRGLNLQSFSGSKLLLAWWVDSGI